MIYRIVKKGPYFHLQCTFERSRVERWILGEPRWHWVRTYSNFEDASRAKAFFSDDDDEDGTVVG